MEITFLVKHSFEKNTRVPQTPANPPQTVTIHSHLSNLQIIASLGNKVIDKTALITDCSGFTVWHWRYTLNKQLPQKMVGVRTKGQWEHRARDTAKNNIWDYSPNSHPQKKLLIKTCSMHLSCSKSWKRKDDFKKSFNRLKHHFCYRIFPGAPCNYSTFSPSVVNEQNPFVVHHCPIVKIGLKKIIQNKSLDAALMPQKTVVPGSLMSDIPNPHQRIKLHMEVMRTTMVERTSTQIDGLWIIGTSKKGGLITKC